MNSKKFIDILHFTDVHGAAFLFEEIKEEITVADLIIISGDITHFGKQDEARKILDKISPYNSNIFAVAGNCDFPVVESFLTDIKIGIHRRFVEFSGFNIVGIGGSLPCPGTTPYEYTEKEVELWLNELSLQLTGKVPFIFIVHQPPYNTLNDAVNETDHVGSKAIRKFILEMTPVLCLTGHIHEGIGIDKLGTCKIVNPGPFRTGKYAKIRISEEYDYDIKLRQITAI